VLFNAAAEDEFEFIGAEGEWIHVQISGPSRGYVRRSNLELPEFIAARLNSQGAAAPVEKAPAFRIVREETSPFPGDWQPLKGMAVKIFTVQSVSQDSKGEQVRARDSPSLAPSFRNTQRTTTASTSAVEGVVVIFDSADGGIVGTTLATLKRLPPGHFHPKLLEAVATAIRRKLSRNPANPSSDTWRLSGDFVALTSIRKSAGVRRFSRRRCRVQPRAYCLRQ